MKVCPTTADLHSHVAPEFLQLVQYVASALLRSRVEGKLDLAACEREIQRLLFVIGAGLVRMLMESQVAGEEQIEIDGTQCRLVLTSKRRFLTRFGLVQVTQHLYRPPGRNQASVSVLERRLGIVKRFFTPGAARLAFRVLSECTLRDASSFCREVGMPVSASTLQRALKAVGAKWEERREEYEAQLRASEGLPQDARTVCLSMDGVMAPMRLEKQMANVHGPTGAKTPGAKTPGEARHKKTVPASTPGRYRELGCGTIATYDKEGERLRTIYHGRMPEERKVTLGDQLADEMSFSMEQQPTLRRVYLADGAKINWQHAERIEALLKQEDAVRGTSVPPATFIVDYFHALEHLKRAADALFGEGTPQSGAWYQERKFWLRHFDGGAQQLLRSLKYHAGRARGPHRSKAKEEVTYFSNQCHRMDYKTYERLNLPIGSGVMEAACKTLVTQRMKRSGMLWSLEGGQAILNIRAWIKSDRFDQAMRLLTRPSLPSVTTRILSV